MKTNNVDTFVGTCIVCHQAFRTLRRGLCMTHYKEAQRDGSLSEYPTSQYLENPEAFIRWAFEYNIDDVIDLAVEYGYRVVNNSH